MKASEKIKNFIKNQEGLRLNAYLCPARVWTIGYGHTGSDVVKGRVITKEQADSYFNNDITIHENNVSKLVKVPLNQNQFDALVSFEYNVGYGNFASSTLLKFLNAKKYNDAAGQFGRWVFETLRLVGPCSLRTSGILAIAAAREKFFIYLDESLVNLAPFLNYLFFTSL